MFAHAGFSTIKTFVMMLGEIDFGGMFAANVTKVGITIFDNYYLFLILFL